MTKGGGTVLSPFSTGVHHWTYEAVTIMTKGAYLLILDLHPGRTIQVGKLGKIDFPAGIYVYAGSALNGLEARVGRHFSRAKRMRWHIDYLLAEGEARMACIIPSEERLECFLNRLVSTLPGSDVVATGFGSSDCVCSSHLHRITLSDLEILMGIFGEELVLYPDSQG